MVQDLDPCLPSNPAMTKARDFTASSRSGPWKWQHGGDRPDKAAGPVPVILITYATTEDAVRRALAAVKRDGVISGAPQVIRIEKNEGG